MVIFKTAILAIILLISINGVAGDFKAIMQNEDILVTNGKIAYVLKPQKVLSEITLRNPIVLLKVYGTDIWLTLHRGNQVKIVNTKNTKFKSTYEYFVLAPTDIVNSSDKNFEIFAQGNTSDDIIMYPNNFCTKCAKPTKMPKKEIQEIWAKLKPKSERSIASVK